MSGLQGAALALTASGCSEVRVRHRPRLLSDNVRCQI
jgi:hypothetical protein